MSEINRRAFLAGTAALALAPVLPAGPLLAGEVEVAAATVPTAAVEHWAIASRMVFFCGADGVVRMFDCDEKQVEPTPE